MNDAIIVINGDTIPVIVDGAAGGTSGGGGSSLATYATRAAMAAVIAVAGTVAFLNEGNRRGLFVFDASNQSAAVTADTLQGLTVPPTSDTTGASGAWVRQWNSIVAHPEWFGAVRDSAGANCAPAIQASHDLCPLTELGPFKYYIGSGAAGAGTFLLTMQIPGRIIDGHGPTQHAAAGFTELVINSASASGVLLGFNADPGGVGDANWLEGAAVSNLSIRRNVATYPLANPAAGFDPCPTGLRMRYAKLCKVTNVYGLEHSMDFYVKQTVACHFAGCRGLRYTAGTIPANDFAVGLFLDYSGATPFNSGNASLFIDPGCGFYSNITTGGAPAYTYNAGIQAYQGFTDLHIDKFESANCGYSIDAGGRSSTALDYHTENLTITNCWHDGVRFAGIRLHTAGPNTAVKITDNYVGCSNATGPTTKGILIDNVHGSVVINGTEYLATVGNPATGVYAVNSSGIVVQDNIYTDLAAPIVFDNVVNLRILERVNVAQVSFAEAILLTNCKGGYVAPSVATSNALLAIGMGVNLSGAGNSEITIDLSGIDSTYMTGGAGNRLVHNGVQIVEGGAFGTGNRAIGNFPFADAPGVTGQAGATYTAASGDAGNVLRFTSAAAVTFTIPPNSAVAFPIGSVIEFEQAGAGAVAVAAGAGVTINSRGADLVLAGQYAVAALRKVAVDTWTLTGDL